MILGLNKMQGMCKQFQSNMNTFLYTFATYKYSFIIINLNNFYNTERQLCFFKI